MLDSTCKKCGCKIDSKLNNCPVCGEKIGMTISQILMAATVFIIIIGGVWSVRKDDAPRREAIAAAKAKTTEKISYGNTTRDCDLHKQPTRKSEKKERVEKGDAIEIYGQKEKWTQIKTSIGRVGWIKTEYIKTAKTLDDSIAWQDKILEEEVQKEQARMEKEKRCKQDLVCWGKKNDLDAIVYGKPLIERFAKYDFKWTDGLMESKISKCRWLNKQDLTLTFIGDKIKFQNGFGAWQNMIYHIDYDPVHEKILDIKVRAGRL